MPKLVNSELNTDSIANQANMKREREFMHVYLLIWSFYNATFVCYYSTYGRTALPGDEIEWSHEHIRDYGNTQIG